MADTVIDGIYRKDPDVGYGVGGINGMHHNDLGWDNTTVGMASNVFDNLLSQNGVRTNDPNYLGALEPIRAGKFIVKWLKVPTFFNVTAVKYLKFFLENAVKSVSGLSENQVASAGSVTFGANQQEMEFPGAYKQNNKNVSLATITCSGDGFGKLMRYWLYGITDPVTGVHHMYGKNLRFCRANYSGSLLYVFLGPTCRPGDIEYACLWNEVWPTSGDGTEKWNSTDIGSDTLISDVTAEFSGIFQDGPEVNILAKYIVAGTGLAGQSYFDQMLPAYMYDKYINNIAGQKAANDTISGLNLSQEYKMSGDNVGEVYTDDIKKVRTDMISKYGLDTEQIPSKNTTFATNINEVDTFGTTTYQDPIKRK